jgi:hypothetical protein
LGIVEPDHLNLHHEYDWWKVAMTTTHYWLLSSSELGTFFHFTMIWFSANFCAYLHKLNLKGIETDRFRCASCCQWNMVVSIISYFSL